MSPSCRVIALVLPDLRIGGGQRVLLELSREFLSAGHRVEIVTLAGDGDLVGELPQGIVYHSLNSWAARSRTLLAITALPALVRLLLAIRPCAVLSSMTGTNLLTAIAHRIAGRPGRLVLREAASICNTPSSVTRWLMRRLYRQADALVAVSNGVADDLIGLGLDPTRVHVIPNPVNPARIRRLAAYMPRSQSRASPYVVSIGRLTPQKDQATLIRAYAASDLRRSHRLVLIGDGDERQALVTLTRELYVEDRVDFLGYMANPYPILRGAALHVLSSRWEGYPNVLLEALALNVPVVATDCPSGPHELLQEGRFGRLAAVGDYLELARAMDAELIAPAKQRELAVAHHQSRPVAIRYAALLLGLVEGNDL